MLRGDEVLTVLNIPVTALVKVQDQKPEGAMAPVDAHKAALEPLNPRCPLAILRPVSWPKACQRRKNAIKIRIPG